jgi:hypothetical protein
MGPIEAFLVLASVLLASFAGRRVLRRRKRSASRALALQPGPEAPHLRRSSTGAYIARLRQGYGVPMAKDTPLLDPRAFEDDALQGLLAGRHLSRDVQRAYEDYLRLRSALGWLMDLEPDNEVAIAMVRGDTSRAEMRLVRLLRDPG